MRAQTLARGADLRPAKTLVARGAPARTFGSLVCSLAVIFLSFGIYLIEDALAHPLIAEAAGLITGALSIALAAILIFYLLKPRKRRNTQAHTFRRGG